jgi:plastocyanin
MKAKAIILIMAVLIAIFISGCTSYGPSASPTTQPTSQSSTVPTAQPTSQVANNASVTIQNFAFSPSTVTILKGGTVIWTNKDSTAHTVTFADGGSPNLNNGDIYTRTFNETGTFDYHCSIHTSMTGKVVVQ